MSRKPVSEELKTQEFLSFVGLQLIDLTGKYPYETRKGRVFGVFDGNQVLCAYSTIAQIKSWIRFRLLK